MYERVALILSRAGYIFLFRLICFSFALTPSGNLTVVLTKMGDLGGS